MPIFSLIFIAFIIVMFIVALLLVRRLSATDTFIDGRDHSGLADPFYGQPPYYNGAPQDQRQVNPYSQQPYYNGYPQQPNPYGQQFYPRQGYPQYHPYPQQPNPYGRPPYSNGETQNNANNDPNGSNQ